MPSLSSRVTGAKEIASEFKTTAAVIQVKINAKTRHFAAILETRIKAKASGRPGPNAPTGDYRRSWNTQMGHDGPVAVADVGTNAVQGRRLELGFHGVDSLGRTYNQPPYEHVDPAVREIQPEYETAVATAWE